MSGNGRAKVWPARATPDALFRGDHSCFFSRSEVDRRRVVAAFLRAGLERGQKVIAFAEPGTEETTLRDLDSEGLDPSPWVRSGQLALVPTDAAYVPDGRFDPERQLRGFAMARDEAAREGFAGLRAIADMRWLERLPQDPEALLDYERRGTQVVRQAGITSICQYPRGLLGPDVQGRLAALHPVHVVSPVPAGVGALVEAVPSDGAPAIRVTGELDLLTARPAARALEALIDVLAPGLEGDLRLDLSDLGFVDVSGLDVLLSACVRLKGRRLVLSSPPSTLLRMLEAIPAAIPASLVVEPAP